MIGFYLFLLLEKILMLLPQKIRRIFFLGLAHFAYLVSKRYKNVVRANLKFVYGKDVSEEFIQKTTKYAFKLLLLNFLHTMEGRYYSVEKIAKKITFKNEHILQAAQAKKKPIIFVTAHYGAWELAGSMLSALKEPVLIVYKKMKNPLFEKYLLSTRKKFRISYVERHGATKGMLKQMRSGGAIAILIDTNVNSKESIIVDFLGKPIGQIQTTAYFARKFDASLIPVLVHTDDDENYTIEFSEEIIPPKTDNATEDIRISTQMQTEWLTKEIFKSPEPWFWLHRRFKEEYPEIYTTNTSK